MAKRLFLTVLKLVGIRSLLRWSWSIVLLPKLKELVKNTNETDFDDQVLEVLEVIIPKLINKI